MKSNVFICPPCGESVARATKEGQNKNKALWPLLPRLTAVLPPQGREMSFGFTLIELLVVVLIIGILAAVAVPQYQKAVEKSKASQAVTLLDSLGKSMEVYRLANGVYPSKFEQMDVDFSAWTGNESWLDDNNTSYVQDVRSNGDWGLTLVNLLTNNEGNSIQMGRLTGPWRGAGWLYNGISKKISCVERTYAGITFQKTQGEYCTKLFGRTNPKQNGGVVEFE